jgi:hypothetical protein
MLLSVEHIQFVSSGKMSPVCKTHHSYLIPSVLLRGTLPPVSLYTFMTCLDTGTVSLFVFLFFSTALVANICVYVSNHHTLRYYVVLVNVIAGQEISYSYCNHCFLKNGIRPYPSSVYLAPLFRHFTF